MSRQLPFRNVDVDAETWGRGVLCPLAQAGCGLPARRGGQAEQRSNGIQCLKKMCIFLLPETPSWGIWPKEGILSTKNIRRS